MQELVPPQGSDIRLVVAGGTVVGGISRVVRPGEWRTNVALGATRVSTIPSPAACELAVHAAAAAGADLLGVDLLPDGSGGRDHGPVLRARVGHDATPVEAQRIA